MDDHFRRRLDMHRGYLDGMLRSLGYETADVFGTIPDAWSAAVLPDDCRMRTETESHGARPISLATDPAWCEKCASAIRGNIVLSGFCPGNTVSRRRISDGPA